jgi:hypothetical protein
MRPERDQAATGTSEDRIMTTHRLRRWAPAAAVALAALPLSFSPASAGGTQRSRLVEFVGTAGSQQFVLDHVVVSGSRHVVPFTRSGSTVSGDFTGTTASAGVGTGNGAGQIAGGEIILFDGSVGACGSGGATIVVFAAGMLGGRLGGTWFVIDGQGTGDLNDLRGGGTLDTPPSGTTTFRGRVSCD